MSFPTFPNFHATIHTAKTVSHFLPIPNSNSMTTPDNPLQNVMSIPPSSELRLRCPPPMSTSPCTIPHSPMAMKLSSLRSNLSQNYSPISYISNSAMLDGLPSPSPSPMSFLLPPRLHLSYTANSLFLLPPVLNSHSQTPPASPHEHTMSPPILQDPSLY